MSVFENMITYAARLETFTAPQPVPKRRASNTKTQKNISWPHSSPSPADLAKAGFFYRPTASSTDNVACFLCRKSLDGWEDEDDPLAEHLHHSPDCGWAQILAVARQDEYDVEKDEHPGSARLKDARKATFQGSWPHEKKRGWACKTEKMVDAGWHYCPLPESDDFVSCAYCGLSLDGWEPKDNPYNEHRRRSPECAFFSFAPILAPTKSTRAKKERTSKAARASIQSNVSYASLAPSTTDLEAAEDDSLVSVATTSSKSAATSKTKSRKKGAKTSVATKAKPSSDATSKDNDLSQTNQAEFEKYEGEILPASAAATTIPTPPRPARAEKRTSDEMDTDQASISVEPEAGGQANALPAKKRRSTRTSRSSIQRKYSPETRQLAEPDVEMSDAADQIPPNTLDGENAAARDDHIPVSTPDENAVPTEHTQRENHLDFSPEHDETHPANTSHLEETDLPRGSLMPQSTNSHHSPVDRQVDQATSSTTSATPSPDREGDKTARHSLPRAAIAGPPTVDPMEHLVEQERDASGIHQADHRQSANLALSGAEMVASVDHEASSPKPNPDVSAAEAKERVSPLQHPGNQLPDSQEANRNDLQSSDAENQAPSTKVKGKVQNDEKQARVTFAPSTPLSLRLGENAATTSLGPGYPWKPAGIEQLLLSVSGAWGNNQEAVNVDDAMEQVKADLTSPEKLMTVEEWIYVQAGKAEERLRSECEQMVNMFESHGMQALRSLESIECID